MDIVSKFQRSYKCISSTSCAVGSAYSGITEGAEAFWSSVHIYIYIYNEPVYICIYTWNCALKPSIVLAATIKSTSPASIYLLKITMKTAEEWQICSKFIIKTIEQRHWLYCDRHFYC